MIKQVMMGQTLEANSSNNNSNATVEGFQEVVDLVEDFQVVVDLVEDFQVVVDSAVVDSVEVVVSRLAAEVDFINKSHLLLHLLLSLLIQL